MGYFHVVSFNNKDKPAWAGLNFVSLDAALSGVTGVWPPETVFFVFETHAPRTPEGYSTVPDDKLVKKYGVFELKAGKLERFVPNTPPPQLVTGPRPSPVASHMVTVELASEFAAGAHEGQKRKYTGEPYMTHCLGVLKLVQEQLDVLGITETLFRNVWEVPAVLHDVLEDTVFTKEQLLGVFGSHAHYVDKLTNKFTAKTHPELNRAARKKLERERYSNENTITKTIKLADVCHNLEGLHLLDPEFYRTYAAEAELLIDVLHVTDAAGWTSGGGGGPVRNNDYLYEKAKAILAKQRS